MAEYFSVIFQYKKEAVGEGFVREFYEQLLQCGFSYKSGFWTSEHDTLDEIMNWNQEKMNKDLCRDQADHRYDYKQMLFTFHDFSEVRLILHEESNHSFCFRVLLPEEDFLEHTETAGKPICTERKAQMELVKAFARQMWRIGSVYCVQTAWECSDVPPAISAIERDRWISIEPFAIVPRGLYRDEWDCSCEIVPRDGLFLRNEDNWFYL